jgi:eukaryotic-like serine/threonine-protein kinase
MGEVFRARDTKLKRDVAITILPEASAADADRLARFQREGSGPASDGLNVVLNWPSAPRK